VVCLGVGVAVGRRGGDAEVSDRRNGPGKLPEYITPTSEFFSFSNGPPPEPQNVEALRLKLGDIGTPVEVPWKEVVSWADREVIRTLQCDGNGYLGPAKRGLGCQVGLGPSPDEGSDHPPPKNWTWRYGGIGTATWNVISVKALLKRVGYTRSGDWLGAAGRDGYFRFFPSELVSSDDFVLAVGMNGEPLPHAHGAPGRLLVPDQYGAMCIKWLQELTAGPMGDERYWDEGSPNHYPVKPHAWAVTPDGSQALPGGAVVLEGIAFAGRRAVKQVLVWTDRLKPVQAEFLDPPRPLVWRRWRATLTLPKGEHRVHVACVDDLGRQSLEQSPYGDAEGFGGLHKFQLEIGSGS
jgi:DMSO/TMAO reductase YedYZ molybdopterin-dependent catalytic subunit